MQRRQPPGIGKEQWRITSRCSGQRLPRAKIHVNLPTQSSLVDACLDRPAASELRTVSKNTNFLRISPQDVLFAKKIGRTRESEPHFAI